MIVVIDYGMGNLRSVAKAIESLGENTVVSRQVSDIRRADRIVLPGVGTFTEGMKNLSALGIIDELNDQVLGQKKPFLGICLGMQLLAASGEENGDCAGLGWFPGKVRRIPASANIRVPHMGWDEIDYRPHPLFAGLPSRPVVYFVHSYYYETSAAAEVIAECDYGLRFAAALARENIFATQFHPEKSQQHGIRILKNFINA